VCLRIHQCHWPTRAREPGRLAGLVREHARHEIAGLADVQRVVGTAKDVDVVRRRIGGEE
jgi:hypothetical protein